MRPLLLLLLVFAAVTAGAQPLPGASPPNDEALEDAVLQYVRPFTTELDATDWRTQWTDLNGDSETDALVYVSGPDWCGSGGCTLLVFEAVTGPDAQVLGRYRPAAEISLVTGPVLVSGSGSAGWRDLVVQTEGDSLRILHFDGETYPGSPGEGVAVTDRPAGDLHFAEFSGPPNER